jgi:hypothetical protein
MYLMHSGFGRLGRHWPLLILLLIELLLVGPLWESPGLPNSADGPLHLHRSAAVARAFASGLLWPRWFPDVYGGLGAPTFHYYSPLFYQLTATLHCAGLALDSAAKSVISIAFFFSALAAFGWLRRLFGSVGALVGALIFLAQPHIFREFYFQGDYPQLLAILLLPVCLWAFTALAQDNRPRDWLLAPLSLALLVLAHNLTAMIGALFLAIYWVLLLIAIRNLPGFARRALAAVVAALISGTFWMPALGDLGMVQVQNLQQDFFHYQQYFLSWTELFSTFRAFDQRAANPPFPHAPGWSAWLAIVAGCVVALFRLKGRDNRWDGVRFWGLAGAGLALASLLLTLPVSAPIWASVPGISLLQFPSRFLPLAALGAALAGAAAVAGISTRWRGPVLVLATAGILAGTAVFLFPRHPFLRFEGITPDQTIRSERENNFWGMTSGNEFLPRWASPPRAAGQGGSLNFVWETPHRATFSIAADSPRPLVLPIHYFPAWTVRTSSGAVQTIHPTEDGRLAVDLAQDGTGDEKLWLVWAGTAWQRRGEMTSLVGLLLWSILSLVVAKGTGSSRNVTAFADGEGNRVGLAIVLLCLWAGRQAVVWSNVDWFQPASPPDSVASAMYPLSVTLGVPGEGEVRLLGWDPLFRGEIRPGDTVGVRLYWQPTETVNEPLHSFLHLYSPDRKQSWAIVQNQNPGRIPTTSWLSALYYVDDLALTVPPDQPPGNFALAVGLVTEEGNRLAVEGSSDGLAEIGRLELLPLEVGRNQSLAAQTSAQATIDELRLHGYDLLPAPGGPILRTYWEATQTPSKELHFFVHLFNGAGERLAQWDGAPLDNMVPTFAWRAGNRYIDRRPLWLPDNLPSGDYTIHVGIYDPATGARLAFAPMPGYESHFVADALVIPFVVPK